MRLTFVAVAALLAASCSKPPAANGVDPALAAEIAKIKAIDNHAHPVRPTTPGEPADAAYDALPVENLEPSTDPVRFRPNGNPLIAQAAQALFNGDRAGAAKAWGANYATTVLDRAGIDRMVANRVAMGPGLPAGVNIASPVRTAPNAELSRMSGVSRDADVLVTGMVVASM